MSQVNIFSVFLCVGRCKNLRSFKFFLRYTSSHLWGLPVHVHLKHRVPHLVSGANSSQSATVGQHCNGFQLSPCRTRLVSNALCLVTLSFSAFTLPWEYNVLPKEFKYLVILSDLFPDCITQLILKVF